MGAKRGMMLVCTCVYIEEGICFNKCKAEVQVLSTEPFQGQSIFRLLCIFMMLPAVNTNHNAIQIIVTSEIIALFTPSLLTILCISCISSPKTLMPLHCGLLEENLRYIICLLCIVGIL